MRPLAIPPLGLIRIMLAAIGFDHEAAAQAAEVGNIGANRDLAPEMRILQFNPMPQRPPEPLLRRCQRGAHVAGEAALALWGAVEKWLAGGHAGELRESCAYANQVLARCNRANRSAPRVPHPVPLRGPTLPMKGRVKACVISLVYAIRQQLLSPSWGEMREWGAHACLPIGAVATALPISTHAPHPVPLRGPTLPTRGRL